jgi:hypothetical protein
MYAWPAHTTRSDVREVLDRSTCPTALGPSIAFAGVGTAAAGPVFGHWIAEFVRFGGTVRDMALDRRGATPDAQTEHRPTQGCLQRLAALCSLLTMLQAGSMVLAAGAWAQANSCDEFKAALAARIESSGVRGYSLETVPAGTPMPPGAKVIGTCESGARKILYSRWGATRTSPGGASAALASAPQASVTRDAPDRRAPNVPGESSVRPVPAPAPNPAPQPDSISSEAASAVPASGSEPETPPPAGASAAGAASALDRPAVQPAPIDIEATPAAKAPLARRASEFLAGNWPWLAVLTLLAVVCWIWVWRAHFSDYDEAGLPRGPRL